MFPPRRHADAVVLRPSQPLRAVPRAHPVLPAAHRHLSRFLPAGAHSGLHARCRRRSLQRLRSNDLPSDPGLDLSGRAAPYQVGYAAVAPCGGYCSSSCGCAPCGSACGCSSCGASSCGCAPAARPAAAVQRAAQVVAGAPRAARITAAVPRAAREFPAAAAHRADARPAQRVRRRCPPCHCLGCRCRVPPI